MHGNAGNISHRLGYLTMFNRLGYSVLLFDYRGYGKAAAILTRRARIATPRRPGCI